MILAKGDMWAHYDPDSVSELWLFTSNGVLKSRGELVMGKGAALQAKKLVPGLDQRFGQLVSLFGSQHGEEFWLYGLLVDPYWPTQNIGAFQTKTHFSHDSTLAMIAFSTGQLWQWCQTHRNIQINLNFPGIGLGGLQRDMVLPVIKWLPSNVTVWEYS